MNLEDRLYSSTEVAEILGVSLRSIYRYLEEGKLDAEVKTVTGRHRFSKKNILDFLYPSGSGQSSDVASTTDTTQVTEVKQKPSSIEVEKPASDVVSRKVITEDASEKVDWLARFRAAQQNKASVQAAPTRESESAVPTASKPSNQTQKLGDTSETTSEPVDWLAKFRAAKDELEKSKGAVASPSQSAVSSSASVVSAPTPVVKPTEPASQPFVQPAVSQPATVAQPVEQVTRSYAPPVQETSSAQPASSTVGSSAKVDSISSFSPQPSAIPSAPVQPKAEAASGFYYYTSGVGGLRELAHSINKSASTSLIPYAFTMYAGMSLFKSIKPFSLLHAYIKAEHQSFFEKALQLKQADKNSAHLCLIVSDDASILETTREMHGFKVVSSVRLRKDLLDAGEDDLVGELDAVSQG